MAARRQTPTSTGRGSKVTTTTSMRELNAATRGIAHGEVLDEETLMRKKKHNLREQRRIRKISDKFQILRDILMSAGCNVKKEKYNILSSTIEYIQRLEKALQDKNVGSIPSSGFQDMASLDTRSFEDHFSPLNHLALQQVSRDEDHSDGRIVLYRNVFHQAGIPSAVCNLDGSFVLCNAKLSQLFGLVPGQVDVSHSLYSICVSEDVQKAWQIIQTITSGGTKVSCNRLHWSTIWGAIPVFVTVVGLTDDGGIVTHIVCQAVPLKM